MVIMCHGTDILISGYLIFFYSDTEAVEVDVSQNRASQVDDGFESLNGNGSSDNNEEEENGEGQVAKSVTIEATDVPPREGVLHGSHIHTIYTCTSTSSDPYTFSGKTTSVIQTDTFILK